MRPRTAGATALAAGSQVTSPDLETALALFRGVGLVVQVEEKLMDAVTGLSGSGPAYAFVAIEALSDAGVREGLPREVATRLAAQTLLGAAQLGLETGDHPGKLKDMVTSPAGTTARALRRSNAAACVRHCRPPWRPPPRAPGSSLTPDGQPAIRHRRAQARYPRAFLT